MKGLHLIILSIALMASTAFADTTEKPAKKAEPVKMRYYLMIGKPTPAVWDMIVKSGGKNMTDPGREATEALGGKIHSYFIGANEAKNYIIVAYPETVTVADIVYMRAAQGVMEELEFIEIIPAENAHLVFDSINSKKKSDNE